MYWKPIIRKSQFGRVHELLINSEKASTSPIFKENVERLFCLRFSITHTHNSQLEKEDFELQEAQPQSFLLICTQKFIL